MRLIALFLFVATLSFVGITPALAENDLPPRPPEFSGWLGDLKDEMVREGISRQTIEAAFANVTQPMPRVVELDRNQPEFKLTLKEYLNRVVPKSRVERAQRRLKENRKLLNEVAAKYNVQPRFIVALWGIETDFGRVTGGFDVVPALVTLIYDGRRATFFKKELIHALRILEEGHIAPEDMKGSWAGAMGQSQFMPSSYTSFAEDYDGDGHKDIWGTRPDVFASIANYLSESGWNVEETWGRRVKLPKGFDLDYEENKIRKPISYWQKKGVRKANGHNLPPKELTARIVLPEGPKGPAYMVYNNFDVTMRWNTSEYFAIAVGKLADGIGTRYTKASQ